MITHAMIMGIAEVHTTSQKWMQSWVYLTLPKVKHTQKQWRSHQEISDFAHHWTENKCALSFLFCYITASTLQVLQWRRWIPNTVQSQEKAVVNTIYELSQKMPTRDSVASDLHWITHYTVKTREKTVIKWVTIKYNTFTWLPILEAKRGTWKIDHLVKYLSQAKPDSIPST